MDRTISLHFSSSFLLSFVDAALAALQFEMGLPDALWRASAESVGVRRRADKMSKENYYYYFRNQTLREHTKKLFFLFFGSHTHPERTDTQTHTQPSRMQLVIISLLVFFFFFSVWKQSQ